MNFTRLLLALAAPMLVSAQSYADDWKSLGQGVYCEDFITTYAEMDPSIEIGKSWYVTIEESETIPGLYRFQPYNGTSWVATDWMGWPDEAYIVIHAENPDKVWMEDFEAYEGMISVSHIVPENEWEGLPDYLSEYKYGTLNNGVISFPEKSLAIVDMYADDLSWASTNRNGLFSVALPGAGTVENDFTLLLDYAFCGDDDKVPVTVTAGSSVKALRYMLKKGRLEAVDDSYSKVDDEIVAEVAANGISIEAGEQMIECSERSIYTLVVVGLDADGNVCNHKFAYIYGTKDNDADWVSLGTTSYTDGFVAHYWDYPEPETMTVELQENKYVKRFYRVVNPYATHSWNLLAGHDSHNHYMYVHAEDPECVYIEDSPIGYADDYGEGHIASTCVRLMEAGLTLDQIKADPDAEVGKINSNNEIVFPKWGLWYGGSKYFNGWQVSLGTYFKLKLPKSAGVDTIDISEGEEAVEYYNIQGIKLNRKPENGLYIEKIGNNATKKAAK